MSLNVDRLLCLAGFHKWEHETHVAKMNLPADPGVVRVSDHSRCTRYGCPRYPIWMTVNVDYYPAEQVV